MVAVSSMQFDVCKELIVAYKANVKLTSEVDGNNALHVLGDIRGLQKEQEQKYVQVLDHTHSFKKIWKLILENGGSLLVQNIEGETPVHLACLRNNISAIRYLLENKILTSHIINIASK